MHGVVSDMLSEALGIALGPVKDYIAENGAMLRSLKEDSNGARLGTAAWERLSLDVFINPALFIYGNTNIAMNKAQTQLNRVETRVWDSDSSRIFHDSDSDSDTSDSRKRLGLDSDSTLCDRDSDSD
ncbi:UNVERIFIED_CONTAM: hypothetical protein FKN15_029659 [Acipenser sinensis]